MNLLRKRWPDLGLLISPGLMFFIYRSSSLTELQTVCWLNFFALLMHQYEEYRLPGTFPGMLNRVMYKSQLPDRFPLNANTALYVNVFFGWSVYLQAAIFCRDIMALAIATMMISLGNVIAHTLMFNIKARTFYNAGMLTSIFLFVPCLVYFFTIIQSEEVAERSDYLIGISLGIVFNYFGILKLIDWNANRNSPYVFEPQRLLKEDRSRLDRGISKGKSNE